jgi:hypothetical protein
MDRKSVAKYLANHDEVDVNARNVSVCAGRLRVILVPCSLLAHAQMVVAP